MSREFLETLRELPLGEVAETIRQCELILAEVRMAYGLGSHQPEVYPHAGELRSTCADCPYWHHRN